jgi:multidrug resistance efflux pump
MTPSDVSMAEVQAAPVAPRRRRRSSIVLLIALAIGGTAAAVAALKGHGGIAVGTGKVDTTLHDRITVKVVRPKRETAVPITVEQIATVEPYYRADLRARASGLVKRITKDIGNAVTRGEVLVEIDVPESEQDVARSEAMILQRQQELKVSQAKLRDAKAALAVSAATIKQREADAEGAQATRDLKKRRFERFRDLAKTGSVVGSVAEEEERDYLTSEAAVTSAKANIDRARADFTESESRIEAAEADIGLKNAQIIVARKDLDRAKAVADYGRIVAPFDGVVVRRTVDPGSFVQNATTGSSDALITVARMDIVTVSARYPDSAAPHVSDDTPATVTVDDLPGVTITGRITRYAPSVQNADRTMQVEMDLFNGSDEQYAALQALPTAAGALKEGVATVPLRAFPIGTPKTRRLLPGMTGTMTIRVGGYGESFVLPGSAVYSRSGAAYILVVEEGHTREVPVKVQLSDGRTTRVVVVQRGKDARGTAMQSFTELTGNETVVLARQLEVGSGATVSTAVADW